MNCKTKFCRGQVLANSKSPFCSKCRSRRFKEKHPLKYYFNLLRCRARERGKLFLLKFEEYEAFCRSTNYDQLKGKTALSLSIDRIDNSGPYSAENIQAITLAENSRKRFVPRLRQYAEQFGVQL